ncbi:MAG TPA: hypothetical protein PL105_01080 [Caldilineaceae bacterium]|nr:hypothetical protein [Caldilineaceae bacterium]
MSDWRERATAALAKLNGEQWADKKKATIVALVDAHLAGVSEETIWARPEVCARNTYHNKWKKDALFAEVLAEVDSLARDWRDNRAVYALGEAAESLRLAAPDAVQRLVAIMGQMEDLTNSRLAATAVLDRAGLETASKSSVDVEMDVRGLADLTDDELQQIAAGSSGGTAAA